jgi:Metallo-peptidase family M12B Reprolysin-like
VIIISTISLKNEAMCLGLQGSFSVLHDYFGYTGTRAPDTISLRNQIELLRNGQHVRIHLKIIENPISFTLDEMVSAMRQAFGNFGIGVFVRTIEDLNTVLPPVDITNFLTIDVVNNCPSDAITNEQINLFNNRNNVGNNEIVVYFVRSTAPMTYNGCANHPEGRPGAIVVRAASRWTLAHEVGHVFGLNHVDSSGSCLFDRLMTGCGTGGITNPPPDLIQSEVDTMNNSDLTRPFEVIVPDVREESAAQAATIVKDACLEPDFTGPNNTNSWVFTQAPFPGRLVPRGSTVTMRLRDDPRP